MSATTDTPASTTPGRVETLLGVLELDGGVKSARTAGAF